MSSLAIAGFFMVIVFIYLIMSERMSAMTALTLIPVIFAVALTGFEPSLGKMMWDGVKQVAPIGIMICFAILYFGVMIDAGLFDPLINKIVQAVEGDPVKVVVGTALLAMIVSLGSDASTTYIVTCSAMLAVYRRVGVQPLILPSIVLMMNSVMNIVPWGGPTGRVLAALKVEANDVFIPLIPAMALSSLWVIFIAYRWGKKERARLSIHPEFAAAIGQTDVFSDPDAEKLKRPQMFWVNLGLTILLMVGLIKEILPLGILFMIGTGLALLINYRSIKEQNERIIANGANAIPVVAMVFAAGIFMGIMSGTKMVDAMAQALIAAVPTSMGPHFAFITAVVSLPGAFFLANDAFYFGVLPILANAASSYGISAPQMGIAALIGQGCHLLSPLVPSTYLLVGLNKIEFGDFQKYALLPTIGISLIWLAYAVVFGLIPL
jgi:CitMHS family citrate-Mg2+:H+ or citrate-Ca2+:H+ symporter